MDVSLINAIDGDDIDQGCFGVCLNNSDQDRRRANFKWFELYFQVLFFFFVDSVQRMAVESISIADFHIHKLLFGLLEDELKVLNAAFTYMETLDVSLYYNSVVTTVVVVYKS